MKSMYCLILRLYLAERAYDSVKHCFCIVDCTIYRVEFEIGCVIEGVRARESAGDVLRETLCTSLDDTSS
jgi:hypothetical protein